MLAFFSSSIIFSKLQRAVIVVSTGYDDDGKGKMAFKLAKKADAVVRSQGGSGTGHAIRKDGKDFNLIILPASAVRKNVEVFLTGGMEVDLHQLFSEIDFLSGHGVSTKGRLWVSSKAHLVMPYQRVLGVFQAKNDKRKRYSSVGTRKGTGWCAAAKRLRRGIRIADLLDHENFPRILEGVLESANKIIVNVYAGKPLKYQDILKVYKEYARRLEPYVKHDVESSINKMIAAGKGVVFEGAQGTFLDVTLGSYPYVSSSSTTASGVCCGAGVGPSRIGHTLGVVKAYATCPGQGTPLPSFIKDKKVIEKLTEATKDSHKKLYVFGDDEDVIGKDLEHLFEKKEVEKTEESSKKVNSNEEKKSEEEMQSFHKKRFGWIDLVMVREAIWINGIDSLAITRLDDLDDLDEIYICYDYILNGKNIDYLPPRVSDARKVVPRFMKVPGWKSSTKNARKLSQLPEKARHYVKKIEQLCNVPVSYISVGPDSKQTILVNDLLPL